MIDRVGGGGKLERAEVLGEAENNKRESFFVLSESCDSVP